MTIVTTARWMNFRLPRDRQLASSTRNVIHRAGDRLKTYHRPPLTPGPGFPPHECLLATGNADHTHDPSRPTALQTQPVHNSYGCTLLASYPFAIAGDGWDAWLCQRLRITRTQGDHSLCQRLGWPKNIHTYIHIYFLDNYNIDIIL